ncbi:ATP binding [Lecanora helva]
MAVLASKASYNNSMGMGSQNQPPALSQYAVNYAHQKANNGQPSHNASFLSPTESEFSDHNDGQDSIRSWDEKRVGEWLRAINCSQYEQIFKVNNVTGSNLIECDQLVLKEMGIKKIGDRVRIFVAIKQLRTKAVGNHRKRNRDSLAALDNRQSHAPYTPSLSSSSRSPRDFRQPESARKRYSQQVDLGALESYHAANANIPRPSSPLAEAESIKGLRAQRHGGMGSPLGNSRKEQAQGYFTSPQSAKTATGLRPPTPNRQNTSMDSTVGKLPNGLPRIRVIFGGGQTKVLDVKNCRTLEDVVSSILKKLTLPENQGRNYYFWNLEGTGQDLTNHHRLTESELIRLCSEPYDKVERGRLIFRKKHAGPPDDEELRKAASIAMEEQAEMHAQASNANNARSRTKVEIITGESSTPLSPSIFQNPTRPNRSASAASQGWGEPPARSDSHSKPRIKEFLGGRPPSEMISTDLTTYFPDYQKETIERTVRMSMRRSARYSKAQSRISVASSSSYTSSLKDAPPLPNIADAWLTGAHGNLATRGPRPLSVSRLSTMQNAYRDSIASSSLHPLQEESPVEPNRKSYVSFDSDTAPSNVNGENETSHATLQSYFEESGSSGPITEAGGSLDDPLTQAIAGDGEEPDEGLDQFLNGETWDSSSWMQGALIGQGSFGSVFLALHAVTGELMAVKQVEVPSNSNSTLDKKKENMVAALKREIDLLRDLKHENIVQYLGSSTDAEHLNIFLEYVPGGSVAAMLTSYGQLHEPLIRNFVRQILAGLSYLHGRDIIHRDIKGANVLVDNKGNIKISDFGISKRVEASALLAPQKNGGHLHRPSLQGSVFWMAPEVVKQTSYTRKADIWSLGCLIVEMFTGTHPFPNCSQLQAIFQIGSTSAKPTTPEKASEEGRIFLSKTFETDHEKRPSADELLLLPFLKQIA